MSAGLVGVLGGVWFSQLVSLSDWTCGGWGVHVPAAGRGRVGPGVESGPSLGPECVCGSCGSARRRVVQSFSEFE